MTTMLVRALMIFAALVLILGTLRGQSSVATYFELKKSEDLLGETVSKLEQEINDLNLEITKIKQSPSYAKKVLRDKYHLTDKNEEIIFFAD